VAEELGSEGQHRAAERSPTPTTEFQGNRRRAEGVDVMPMTMKRYRKSQVQPMRPYVPGEDLTGVSVSAGDTGLGRHDCRERQ
jgi:hypothetical protein